MGIGVKGVRKMPTPGEEILVPVQYSSIVHFRSQSFRQNERQTVSLATRHPSAGQLRSDQEIFQWFSWFDWMNCGDFTDRRPFPHTNPAISIYPGGGVQVAREAIYYDTGKYLGGKESIP